jgi:hypothetical protein
MEDGFIGLLVCNSLRTYERVEVNTTCFYREYWTHLSGHFEALTTFLPFDKRLVCPWGSCVNGTLSVFSEEKIQVRHPCNTTDQIIYLYSSVFSLTDSRLELNGSNRLQNLT